MTRPTLAVAEEIVSIRETDKGVWRVSFGGRVYGDSRGYDREGAIRAARKEITGRIRDHGDWSKVTREEYLEGKRPVWIEKLTVYVLDPALA